MGKKVLMSQQLKTVLIAFSIVNVSFILCFVFYRLRRAVKLRRMQSKMNRFGDSAEMRVNEYLSQSFPGAVIFNNIYLKTGIGLTQLDHLLICSQGIYIVETKSHNGYIITRGNHWTQRWRDKTVRFHSPTIQNEIHRKALERILKSNMRYIDFTIRCVTVFTSKNVRFSKKVDDVIKLSELNSYIRANRSDKVLYKPTIEKLRQIVEENAERSRLRQRNHRQKIFRYNVKKGIVKLDTPR